MCIFYNYAKTKPTVIQVDLAILALWVNPGHLATLVSLVSMLRIQIVLIGPIEYFIWVPRISFRNTGQTDRDRQTYRQTEIDRQTDIQTDKVKERWIGTGRQR